VLGSVEKEMKDTQSPDFSETLVGCFGHSTFFEHVVTHIAEDLKLFFTGESVCVFAVFHDLEHVCFVGDHWSLLITP
jgi:hypothetical protein